MAGAPESLQYLLTLPPAMARDFSALEGRYSPTWFATSDPEGQSLGSGGGTSNLLIEAWRATAPNCSFDSWLQSSRKLVMHAGGESRRLPAYAPTGKLLIPIPVFRWARGQRLDQTLLDIQLPTYERVLAHASPAYRLMLTSGDVLLRFSRRLPSFPEVDVLGLGMWVSPEIAEHFGVFFLRRGSPGELAFSLQKPRADRIRELASDYLALVDTGMWLLSERAVHVLLKQCGWLTGQQQFSCTRPGPYDFYGQFATALGKQPTFEDADIRSLSCAVVTLPDAQFYHFGTSRQIIESVAAIQNLVLDTTRFSLQGGRQRPDQVTQNSTFPLALHREGNEMLWIENSQLSEGWEIASEHILTGIPPNDWKLKLAQGVCLDIAPVGESDFCIRPYHIDDTFNGTIGDPGTRWMGSSVQDWFSERGLQIADSGLDPGDDIQKAPLFPRVSQLMPGMIQWLIARPGVLNPEMADTWRRLPRLSAHDLVRQTNLRRLHNLRDQNRNACLPVLLQNFRRSIFFRLDLDATARLFAATPEPMPDLKWRDDDEIMRVHEAMFRAEVTRYRGDPNWQTFEDEAFSVLRTLIRAEAEVAPALPICSVQEDQIVWARSPVRLDLAGGWTDTPPYCIEHGGKVLNLAVDLNGQPPVQVFARLSPQPGLVLRSIDLGCEEHVQTYAELEKFGQPQAPFALAKAAFALAGFLPAFHKHGGFSTLEEQLNAFGGGIDISLLCAVPKGSGLGTSSILSTTILAALNDLCGLGWDRNILLHRTLVLEQMLTTGGGWQDQAGALFGGIKLVETTPGLRQQPTLRWLPQHLFGRDYANASILLYYTGLTRLAKNILAEIVRGVFLNSPARLDVLDQIAANAESTAAAVQSCDYVSLQDAVQRSWLLNQELDSGTNPPALQQILSSIHDHIGGAKLLGAGGGGYLLILAKDVAAGQQVRHILNARPPNKKARFVDFQLSETGLQITRS